MQAEPAFTAEAEVQTDAQAVAVPFQTASVGSEEGAVESSVGPEGVAVAHVPGSMASCGEPVPGDFVEVSVLVVRVDLNGCVGQVMEPPFDGRFVVRLGHEDVRLKPESLRAMAREEVGQAVLAARRGLAESSVRRVVELLGDATGGGAG